MQLNDYLFDMNILKFRLKIFFYDIVLRLLNITLQLPIYKTMKQLIIFINNKKLYWAKTFPY